MNNSTKELLLISLEAHLKYMEQRILDKNKQNGFIRSVCRMILMLETDFKYDLENIYCNQVFTSSVIDNNTKNKEYIKGVYFAIDLYKEIYYNLLTRFEEGWSETYE
jgi:hypothetical protein